MKCTKCTKVLLIFVMILCVVGILTACGGGTGGTDAHTYLLTFHVNGGGGDNTTVVTNGHSEVILPTAPHRDNYLFKGWFYDIGTWKKEFTARTLVSDPISSNKTVYARWEQANLSDDDGGSSETPVNPVAYSVTLCSILDGVPKTTAFYLSQDLVEKDTQKFVNAGYTLTGWYLDAEFNGDPIVFPYKLTENITIYAKWERIRYTITFDGGEGASGTAPEPLLKASGENFELPANPFFRYDFVFVGWKDGESVYDAGSVYQLRRPENVVFTAQWEQSLTLTYLPGGENDVAGTPPAQVIASAGTVIRLAANPFTREGYIFAGWRLIDSAEPEINVPGEGAEGDDTPGEPAKTIFRPNEEYTLPARHVQFEAVWTAVYKITYAGGGATGGAAPEVRAFPAGTSITLELNTFEKEDSVFEYWTLPGDDTKYYAVPLLWFPSKMSFLPRIGGRS